MRGKKGFTLLELLVVVIIIGILAAIALPRFMGQTERAKMTEALNAMASIREAEHTHEIAEGSYTSYLNTLGFSTGGGFTLTGGTTYTGRHWSIVVTNSDVVATRTAGDYVNGTLTLNVSDGNWSAGGGYPFTPSEG